jgi:hypothetical protein
MDDDPPMLERTAQRIGAPAGFGAAAVQGMSPPIPPQARPWPTRATPAMERIATGIAPRRELTKRCLSSMVLEQERESDRRQAVRP